MASSGGNFLAKHSPSLGMVATLLSCSAGQKVRRAGIATLVSGSQQGEDGRPAEKKMLQVLNQSAPPNATNIYGL